MEWSELKPGQEVMFRFLGGWKRGRVKELLGNSASIAFASGANTITTRVHDPRNIKPCKELKKAQSMSPDLPLFDSWNTPKGG